MMAQVGNAIRKQHELLMEQEVNTIFEWNAGNHFVDSDKRMAKGFAWLLNTHKKPLLNSLSTVFHSQTIGGR